jgi:hypothetical protein
MNEEYWTPSLSCKVCGAPSVPRSYLCVRCRHLMRRVETRKDASGRGRKIDMSARFRSMQEQWDSGIGAFRCYYTRIPLVDAHGSRRSATWEHVTPGDESSVVLVADLINKMKGDMQEGEFRTVVTALAAFFSEGSFDESAFPLDR